jgi:hypothetical protein
VLLDVLSDGTHVTIKGLPDGTRVIDIREDEMVQPRNAVESNSVDFSSADVDKVVCRDEKGPHTNDTLTEITDVDVPIPTSQIKHAKEVDTKQTKLEKPAPIQHPEGQNIPIPIPAEMHLKEADPPYRF